MVSLTESKSSVASSRRRARKYDWRIGVLEQIHATWGLHLRRRYKSTNSHDGWTRTCKRTRLWALWSHQDEHPQELLDGSPGQILGGYKIHRHVWVRKDHSFQRVRQCKTKIALSVCNWGQYLYVSVVFKTLSIGAVPGWNQTSRSAVKRSTDLELILPRFNILKVTFTLRYLKNRYIALPIF